MNQTALCCILAYSDGQRIGQIAAYNGTTNADFVRFGSCDQLQKFVGT